MNSLQQLNWLQRILVFISSAFIRSWKETWRWEFPCHTSFLKLLQACLLVACSLITFYILNFPQIRELQSFKLTRPERSVYNVSILLNWLLMENLYWCAIIALDCEWQNILKKQLKFLALRVAGYGRMDSSL